MVDYIKRDVSKMVEEYSAKTDDNPFSKIIPALMKKGLENVNLSMFSDDKKKELLNAAAEEYLKRNQLVDAIRVFKMTGNRVRLISIGDDHVKLGLFGAAIEAYKLAEDKEKLLKAGEKCLDEGHLAEAIAAFKG